MAWSITANVNDGYPHNENTVYMLTGLTAPYPDGMWESESNVNDGYPHTRNTKFSANTLTAPYPDGLWKLSLSVNSGYPFQRIDNTVPPGACCMCENLNSITIPASVLSIGRYAFYGTALSSVCIAPACEYHGTSFPEDCEVYHYTEDSNLVDKNGRYLMSKDKKLLKLKESDANG